MYHIFVHSPVDGHLVCFDVLVTVNSAAINIRVYTKPGSVVKNSSANVVDLCLIPGSRRSPGEGNGNPLQHSCLGNPKGRGAWRAIVHGVAKESDMT